MFLLKRAFGVITLATGATLLVAALGQKILLHQPFRWGPLFGGVTWAAISWHFGRRWLFNWIDLYAIAVDPRDPAISAATRQAQDTLPLFWSYLEQQRYECTVKFRVEYATGKAEHIWAVVQAREGDHVAVSWTNDPDDTASDEDERSLVAVNAIEDWQVAVSPTEIRGGYSVAALAGIATRRGYSLAPRDRKLLSALVDVPRVAGLSK